jgi:hypothetical protein
LRLKGYNKLLSIYMAGSACLKYGFHGMMPKILEVKTVVASREPPTFIDEV